jgi:hypothetical protein
LTVEVGQSAQASLALTTVVEQFVQASLVSAVEPIFEVERELVSEVEYELFSLLV